MSLLRYEYKLKLKFSAPVKNHCFILRVRPQNGADQRAGGLKLEVSPHTALWKSCQRTGEVIMGRTDFTHDSFTVSAKGYVETLSGSDTAPPALSLGYPSFVTQPGSNVEALLPFLSETDETALVLQAMDVVHACLVYTPGVTGADTTAEEALALKAGVCQDYAHIFCALMRRLGYPTRYVAGLNYGCGATHAWNEIYCGGQWVGIDCTNNKRCDDGYIKLASGCDAEDCALNRGVFSSLDSQQVIETQEVEAKVEYA